jgi:hypothetical protein
MEFPSAIDAVYLALGAALLGLIVYCWHRRKQRSLVTVVGDGEAESELDTETFSDNFYCIMLTDGTCRSGYIDAKTERGDSAIDRPLTD